MLVEQQGDSYQKGDPQDRDEFTFIIYIQIYCFRRISNLKQNHSSNIYSKTEHEFLVSVIVFPFPVIVDSSSLENKIYNLPSICSISWLIYSLLKLKTM